MSLDSEESDFCKFSITGIFLSKRANYV